MNWLPSKAATVEDRRLDTTATLESVEKADEEYDGDHVEGPRALGGRAQKHYRNGDDRDARYASSPK